MRIFLINIFLSLSACTVSDDKEALQGVNSASSEPISPRALRGLLRHSRQLPESVLRLTHPIDGRQSAELTDSIEQ